MKTFNIGRGPSNEIILDDKMVSRKHAQLIILDNGQVIIKDIGSSNGTYVNGNRITECGLKAGDIVKCGNTFVKWSQYAYENPSPASGYQQQYPVAGQEIPNYGQKGPEIPPASVPDFTLGKALKQLSTRVYDSGELFTSNWKMNSSILFFLIAPLCIVLLAGITFYSKIQVDFVYQVITPFFLAILVFGVSQFLSIILLSIGKETSFVKNIFASSVFSFLNFSIFLINTLVAYLIFKNKGIIGIRDTFPLISLYLLALTITVVLLITMLIFINKYFRIIGISKGVSIHFTVFAFAINLFFQILFLYIFTLTIKIDLFNLNF